MEPAADTSASETSPSPPKKGVRVIDSFWTFLVATAVLGPFALPLLWRNPRVRWPAKVAGTVVVLGITWGLVEFMNWYAVWFAERTGIKIQFR